MNAIRSIVSAAIHLQNEDRQIFQWEAEVGHAERSVELANPVEIGRLCRSLGRTYSMVQLGFSAAKIVHEEIQDRAMQGSVLEGANELFDEQKQIAGQNAERLISLRNRLRALDSSIGDALAKLRDQSIEERLARIIAQKKHMASITEQNMSPRLLEELHKDISEDHEAIANAMGDWRLMHGAGAVMTVAKTTSKSELKMALENMVKAGSAIRYGTPFLGYRWAFPEIEEAAKSA